MASEPEGAPKKLLPVWGECVESIPDDAFVLPPIEYSLVNPKRAPLEVWNDCFAHKYAFIRNPNLGNGREDVENNTVFLDFAASVHSYYHTYPQNEIFQPDGLVQIRELTSDLLHLDSWNRNGALENSLRICDSMMNVNNFLLDFFVQLPDWEEAGEMVDAKHRDTYEMVNTRMRENELLEGDQVLLNGRALPHNPSNQIVLMRGSEGYNSILPKGGGDTTIFIKDGELALHALLEFFSRERKPAHQSFRALEVLMGGLKGDMGYPKNRALVKKVNAIVDYLGVTSRRMMEWLSQDERTAEYCASWQYTCENIVERRVRNLGKEAGRFCEDLGLSIANWKDPAVELEKHLLSRLLP